MSIKDGIMFVLFIACVQLFSLWHYNKKERSVLKKQNQALHREVDHLVEQYRLTEQAYHALSETKLQIGEKTKTVIKRIYAAPKSDDAPLAPVLKETLEAIE